MMRCPVCAVDMFVLEFERVEIDYCYACGAPEGARPRGKRPCPVCARAMQEVRTETEPPIVVDRCARGHGLWFDRGELSAAVQAAGADEENVLARFFEDLDRPARRGQT